MQSRIKNPAMLFPDALQAALALASAVEPFVAREQMETVAK